MKYFFMIFTLILLVGATEKQDTLTHIDCKKDTITVIKNKCDTLQIVRTITLELDTLKRMKPEPKPMPKKKGKR